MCSLQKRGGRRGPQPRRSPGLPETKRRGRAQRMNKDAEELESRLQRLDLNVEAAVPVGTGLAFDERLTEFHCLWDDRYLGGGSQIPLVRLYWPPLRGQIPKTLWEPQPVPPPIPRLNLWTSSFPHICNRLTILNPVPSLSL
uniref:Uncharacterized protein n=1 Tax=Terrapene triunguis TaxID=2587831 RepID=A0A674J1S9_9SAUR